VGSFFENGAKGCDANAAAMKTYCLFDRVTDEVAIEIGYLEGVAQLEGSERFLNVAALLRGEAGGEANMAFVRSGSDGEPASEPRSSVVSWLRT
jgi:hypothetical protein